VSVLDIPVTAGRPPAKPDDNHLYCCDPDTSLCGLDLTDSPELDFADEECCTGCRAVQHLPCSVDCPVTPERTGDLL
jgi:hypothetical protein